jgi:hypothetical protein
MQEIKQVREVNKKSGGYGHLPKNTHHYEWNTEDTVIQPSGIKPVGMTHLDPSDDSRKNQ